MGPSLTYIKLVIASQGQGQKRRKQLKTLLFILLGKGDVMLGRLFSDGYRVFFLAAGLSAVAVVLVWEFYLGVHATGGMMTGLPFAMPPHVWHAHELVFGYGAAALTGFLYTAVPSWTGRPPVGRGVIVATATLWLAGRIAVWMSGALPGWLVAVLDLGHVPLLLAVVTAMLWHRPKAKNLVFPLLLALFWLANLATHLGWAGLWDDGEAIGLRAGMMALAGMILVIGRMTPAFTRNAMMREASTARRPRDWARAGPVMIGFAALLPVAALAAPDSPVTASLMIAAGVAQLIRQSRWGWRFAATRPILASLHLSVAMLALGLILTGLSVFTGLSEVAGLHVLGIGGIGGMTLAVMSRATLGHSGLPLIAPVPIALAYGALPLAALMRWIASEAGGAAYFPATLTAGALWIAAFTAFTATLWPAFWGERAGGE